MIQRALIVGLFWVGWFGLSSIQAEDEIIVVLMPDEVKAKFAKLDRDSDRRLTWEEYRTSVSKDREAAARRDFKLFDLDADGNLTADEYWSIPSSVSKTSTRGPLPDPVIGVLRTFIATLDKHFDDWDQNPERQVPANTFKWEVAATIKFDPEHFTDEEVDPNRNGVTREEARRFIEIHFGVLREDGRLLREPNGRVRQHQRFQSADVDQDGRLIRQEFVEGTFIPGDLSVLFQKGDVDRDGGISWDEWCDTLNRVTDPITDFLKLDTNLDGRVNREEILQGTPKHQQETAQFVFPGFDFDRDGQLTLNEYRLTTLANPVAKWHDAFQDHDGDDRLSFSEFNPGTDVPLLRFVIFQRLDTNRDGVLDDREYSFKHRARCGVFALNVETGAWRKLFQLRDYPSITSMAVSPDGERLAFDAHREGQTFNDDVLLTAKLDGSELHNLGRGKHPGWSPDGQKLAATRSPKGAQEAIAVMLADGTEERKLATGRGPQWSPDGKRIAFSDPAALQVFDLATEKTTRLCEVQDRAYDRIYFKLAWSPDGKQLAFVGHKPDGTEELMKVSVDEQPPQPKLLFTNRTIEGSISWHRDGDRLVFPMRNQEQKLLQLFELNPNGDKAPTLVKGQPLSAEVRAACWTADGKQIIVVIGNY